MKDSHPYHLVQLTPRETQLFRKLNDAGWLTTPQIQAYFFPGKSRNAVSNRLRKLTAAGYLADEQISSTETKLHRLAGRGRRSLEEQGGETTLISLPTQVPRKLRHFIAVNDLRCAFDTATFSPATELAYFHSEREYPLIGRSPSHPLRWLLPTLSPHQLIPDAIAGLRSAAQELTFGLEYDAGTEPAHYFGRQKMQRYLECWAQNPTTFSQFRLLVVAATLKRLLSLMRQTALLQPPPGRFFFALHKKFSTGHWPTEAILLDPTEYFVVEWEGEKRIVSEKPQSQGSLPKHTLLSLLATSPCSLSSREDRQTLFSPSKPNELTLRPEVHY